MADWIHDSFLFELRQSFGDSYFTTRQAAALAKMSVQKARRLLNEAKENGRVKMEIVTSASGVCSYWSFDSGPIFIAESSDPILSEVTLVPQLFGDERARYLEIKTYHEKFGRSYPTERTTNVQKIQS